MNRLISIAAFVLLTAFSAAAYQPETSVAGFYDLPQSGRETYNFNVGWRFSRGDFERAAAVDFDDSGWDVVATPHTVELIPAEGSGGRNYQGVAWYRKHFTIDPQLEGRRVTLHFEAVMGKCEVFVNGRKAAEHFGGYLPFSINLTALGVKAGEKCVVAVRADNSDDKAYPPGKPQNTLDFTYHGGIYRDVWMIATAPVYVTDANRANAKASGGVFVHYGKIDKSSAEVFVDTHINNSTAKRESLQVETLIKNAEGKTVASKTTKFAVSAGQNNQVRQPLIVKNPELWSPDSPTLYRVETRVTDLSGKPIDGVATRIGIRKIEFSGTQGLVLNGKPFGQIIGTNRHQDFAYVGNALPNSGQWRDAKIIREAGCRIIRSAHYPQDPAFMDACDELGIFMIVATPGWQYYNKDSIFVARIYDDVRNMIRRDRNHPSVIMWEPVLNETPYPLSFTEGTIKVVREEYPYPGSFIVADNHGAGVADNFDVVYGWPADQGKFKQPIFTREFGETVDDWYAHNTDNRASRSWGENAQVAQAATLANSYDAMYETDGQFMGGAQWHSFDHQRGYHPDPYWGGFADAFRQPKYAFYMFRSQMEPNIPNRLIDSEPMVFVAHEISAFSGSDVTVFSNCDSVRMIVYERDTLVQAVVPGKFGMPHAPTVFKDVYKFSEMRVFPYVQKNWSVVSFVVEGIKDGKVVCSTTKMPSRRSTKLRLSLETAGQQLVADGSDFAVVVAEVTDDEGNVRRLAKERIVFTVEGEGEIIGDETIGANPREVEFGSAPVLVRSTVNAGKIRVSARVLFEGYHAPTAAEIEFESVAPGRPLVYSERPAKVDSASKTFGKEYEHVDTEEQKRRELMRVEKQQTEFGEKF